MWNSSFMDYVIFVRVNFSAKDDRGARKQHAVCRNSGKQRGTFYFSSVDNFTGKSCVPDSQNIYFNQRTFCINSE